MEVGTINIEVPNLRCGDCEYFLVNADMDNVESKCKRIDHKKIQFAVPFFKSYDCNQFSGCICSDFKPNEHRKHTCENWTNFEDYWKLYVEQWLPYQNMNKNKGFVLNRNTEVRYYVPLLKFVYGDMFQGGKLMAVEKVYYKRCNTGCGYKLVREKINGIEVE